MKQSFNKLALLAVKNFEAENNIKLAQNDEIYVWHWFDEDNKEYVKINIRNHNPEGVFCMVENLNNINDWWDQTWDQKY